MARSLILAGNRPWGGSSSSWLAWGAAAAVAMGLYVAFGPSTQLSKGQRKKRQRLGYPMGLRNEGNSCFINAILQCLSACEEFHSWLELQAGPQQEQDQMDLVSALLKSIRLINRLDLHPVDQDDFSAVLVLKALRFVCVCVCSLTGNVTLFYSPFL